ncbi:GNAT family N-acetyltransferase [Paenibacillus silvae]|nr:GNAT family N-acetyltransferase [Paenibacillus silvae]
MNKRIYPIEDQLEKRKMMPLLLLADESEEKVMQYLEEGDVLCLSNDSDDALGVIVTVRLNSESIEIKNIAVSPDHQGQGFGKLLINKAISLHKERGIRHFVVGTANSSINNLAFYQKLGFRICDIKKDFFLDYPEEIWENGIRAVDMIVMEKHEVDSK